MLLEAYDKVGILNDTLVLVIADHGGQTEGHGFTNQKNIDIPWIAKGPGVSQNYVISSYVRNMDTPATAMHALGIEQPKLWMGRPITEIYNQQPYQSPPGPNNRLTGTVISLVISGLNSAGMDTAFTPIMDSLISKGSYAQHARGQMPSTSLTNIAR